MAAPSIAALYRNSDAPSSAKTREYPLDEIKQLVAHSGAPPTVVAVTLAALSARGAWPNQDGPATTTLSVSLLGIMFDSTPSCCRRTAQRRIKRALKDQYWRCARDAHSWTDCPDCGEARSIGKCGKFDDAGKFVKGCGYEGRSKDANGNWTGEFMRVPTYEFDIDKFRRAQRPKEIRHFDARTYAEYKEAAKRGEQAAIDISSGKPAQPAPPPPPPAPATPPAPVPERAKPAAEAIDRQHSRRITRDEKAALFNAYIALKRSGMAHEPAIAEVQRQFHSRFSPEDIDYAVKIVGPPPQPEPKAREIRCYTCGDERLVLNLNNGPGEKRLIPCPKCGVQSP